MIQHIELFGMPFIADKNHDAILDAVCAWPLTPLSEDELPILCTPNVDQLVRLFRPENSELMARLKLSRFVLPDGQRIVTVSRYKRNKKLPARLAGSDLFPLLWRRVVDEKIPFFMVLSSEEVAVRLRKDNADLRHVVPPFYTVGEASEAELIESVHHELKAHPVPLVFIGLGFPKQERLALALIDRFKAEGGPMPLFLLLGASFEFHVGLKQRAPKIIQFFGLEFLHRVFKEPRRLFRRYLIEDMAFFPMAYRELRK